MVPFYLYLVVIAVLSSVPSTTCSPPSSPASSSTIINDNDDGPWYTSLTLPSLSPRDPVNDLGLASVQRTSGTPRVSLYRSVRAPLATNKFYMNLVLGSGSGAENTIDILPYIIQATSSLIIYYPNVLEHSNAQQYQNVYDPIFGYVAMGSLETEHASSIHQMVTADELAVTLAWSATTPTGDGNNGGRMQSSLVRGSPYVSMSYVALTPLIASRQSLVRLMIDGIEYACNGRLLPLSRRWTFHLRQFDHTWQLWSSQPIRLRCEATPVTTASPLSPSTPAPSPSPAPIRDHDDIKQDDHDDNDANVDDDARRAFLNEPIMANAGFVLQSTSLFTGTLRLALVNNCTTGSNRLWCPSPSLSSPLSSSGGGVTGVDQSQYAALLDRHHSAVVTGAKLRYQWNDDNDDTTDDDAVYAFDWMVVPLHDAHVSLMNDISMTSFTRMSSSVPSSPAADATVAPSSSWSLSSLSMKRTCDTHRSSGPAIPLATAMTMMGIDITTAAISPPSASSDASSLPLAEPLLFALPHHIAAFSASHRASLPSNLGGHRNIRGFMQPVIASTWRLHQSLTNIGLRAPRVIPSIMMDDIRHAVRNDANYDLPVNYRSGTGDPYFAGKMLARMARIILIADELHMMDIVDHLVPRLRNYTSIWLHGLSANQLVYDATWGGIVTCGCLYDDGGGTRSPSCTNIPPVDCPALRDPGMDFGNGFYNDHHLQFGYHIYAAAVVARFDTQFIRQSGEHVLLLIRSIANPSSHDAFFPLFRHMDWYFGHSWAGGVPQPFQLGRNQESSSEAINAWYAIYLWGQVTNTPTIKNIGRLLLSVELRSVQMYWHIPDDSPVYPASLWRNRMVGIIWSNLAQYSTWFGSSAYEVHGIQLLPITPITESLLSSSFASQQWPVFDRACTADDQCRHQGWYTLAVCNQAIAYRDDAWIRALALTDDV